MKEIKNGTLKILHSGLPYTQGISGRCYIGDDKNLIYIYVDGDYYFLNFSGKILEFDKVEDPVEKFKEYLCHFEELFPVTIHPDDIVEMIREKVRE